MLHGHVWHSQSMVKIPVLTLQKVRSGRWALRLRSFILNLWKPTPILNLYWCVRIIKSYLALPMTNISALQEIIALKLRRMHSGDLPPGTSESHLHWKHGFIITKCWIAPQSPISWYARRQGTHLRGRLSTHLSPHLQERRGQPWWSISRTSVWYPGDVSRNQRYHGHGYRRGKSMMRYR